MKTKVKKIIAISLAAVTPASRANSALPPKCLPKSPRTSDNAVIT